MLSSILNVIALLALTGIGVYWVVSTPLLRERLQLRRTFVGIVIGAVTALMGQLNLTPETVSYIALVIGPLLLAGYVGGFGGALAAGLLSALPFYASDAFAAVLGQHLAAAGVGAVLAHRLFGRGCVGFSASIFAALLACAAVLTVIHATLFPHDPAKHLLSCIGMATASTAIAYGMLALAIRAARNLRALAEFEARMKLASQVAQIGTWDWDVTSDLCTWDEGMHRLYGTDPAAPKIKPNEFIAKVHPDDRLRLQTTYEVISIGGAPQHDEFRAYRADGALRTIHSALNNQYDPAGRLIRISGLHMDVTNLRAAEAQRGAAETRLHDVVSNVPGALMTYRLDRGGKHSATFLNPFCAQMLELSPKTVHEDGRALFRLVHPDDILDLTNALKQSIRCRAPFVQRWRMILPSGTTIWVEGHGTPRLPGDGGIEFCAILINITDLVKAQSDLAAQKDRNARTERLETIGKLSGGVAHDFNNLLAIIVGNLELLREELAGDEERQGYVREALHASLRGADLVRSMLTFAQRARLQPEAHPVSDLLTRVDSWVMRVLPATIDVTTELSEADLRIHVDPAGAENALVNLVLNARDAMPDGGSIRISAERVQIRAGDRRLQTVLLRPGAYVAIKVTDSGHGIPPEHAEKVFEPFFSTRQPGRTSGSGLGLPSVQGFIEQSGGGIEVESTPGKGTRITLYMPMEGAGDTARPAPQPKQAARPARDGLRILLAEDEAPVAQVLKRTLELEGYTVSLAPSGDAAVVVHEQEGPFDLLLTDIVMPGQLQGPQLAARLRAEEPTLPAVFLSGYAPDTICETDGIQPEDRRLMKPVTRRELIDAVAAALPAQHQSTAAE